MKTKTELVRMTPFQQAQMHVLTLRTYIKDYRSALKQLQMKIARLQLDIDQISYHTFRENVDQTAFVAPQRAGQITNLVTNCLHDMHLDELNRAAATCAVVHAKLGVYRSLLTTDEQAQIDAMLNERADDQE